METFAFGYMFFIGDHKAELKAEPAAVELWPRAKAGKTSQLTVRERQVSELAVSSGPSHTNQRPGRIPSLQF